MIQTASSFLFQQLAGFGIDKAWDFMSNLLTSLTEVKYSAKRSQLDDLYNQMQSLSDALGKLGEAIKRESLWITFNNKYTAMNDYKLEVKLLMKNVEASGLFSNSSEFMAKYSSTESLKEWINDMFELSSIDPTVFYNETINLMNGFQPAPVQENKTMNYYQLMDYMMSKAVPWEEQGFSIRETLRSSDALAFMDAVQVLNMYYVCNMEGQAKTACDSLNNAYSKFLTLLGENLVDYTDYNRDYAVCCIEGAHVKFKKEGNFANSLISIFHQLNRVQMLHASAATGPGSGEAWPNSVDANYPDSYQNNTSLDDHPEYYYHFKIDDLKNNPGNYPWYSVMKTGRYSNGAAITDYGNKRALLMDAVSASEITIHPYLSIKAIQAINNYYAKMNSSSKTKTSNTDLKNNNFLYALVDGGVYKADQIVSWMNDKTYNVIPALYAERSSSGKDRWTDHQVAVLYDEGKIYYKINSAKLNDYVWYSMFRTTDNTLFDQYDEGVLNNMRYMNDQQNLILLGANINGGRKYLNSVPNSYYLKYVFYFHPNLTIETY